MIKSVFGISTRGGTMVIFVAALTLAITTFLQVYYSHKAIREEASLRAESELNEARKEIMDIVDQTEAAVRNSIWISQLCLNKPDTLSRVPMRVVLDNPVVMGSTVALIPGYNKRVPLFAPYAVRDSSVQDGFRMLSLATESYNYPAHEWFTAPQKDQNGYWSEPYFDEGGGDLLMTTFSLPVKDADGQVAAILTADLSLDWLGSVVGEMRFYPNAISTIVSRAGNTLISEGDALAAKEKYQTYTSGVARTGWTLSIVVPERDLMASVHKVGMAMVGLSILGVVMLIIILQIVTKNLIEYQRTSEQKERMLSELKIGHDIQMSMVPQSFPAFPDRKDLDFAAAMIPAKEVGGDLYDYYIRDEKLFFCIGDVSGKGVPASLVMSVTCTLFRAISSHHSSPARIVTSMNNSLSRNNKNDMFVTFFLGVLDLASGRLSYCNAGHNPPLLLSGTIRPLNTVPNLPLGVVSGIEFKEQEVTLHPDDAMFLFTDGVTEAENAEAQQFGDDRMEQVLHTRRPAAQHLEAMQAAVKDFVGDAPQSDDLTMLFIHYLG